MPDPSGSRTSMTTMLRLEPARLFDGLGDRTRLGHDLESLAPVEQRDEPLPDDLVVVDDQQPHHGTRVVSHVPGSPTRERGRER